MQQELLDNINNVKKLSEEELIVRNIRKQIRSYKYTIENLNSYISDLKSRINRLQVRLEKELNSK